jgi:Flp pilus assembly protein TadD
MTALREHAAAEQIRTAAGFARVVPTNMCPSTSAHRDRPKLLQTLALAMLFAPLATHAQVVGTLSSSPTSTDSCPLAQARALIEKAAYSDAEQSLKLCIQHDNGAVDARYLLAYALMRDNKPKESLVEYTSAARLRTPSAEDLKNVALDYVLLNDYTDAEKWMTASLARNPGDSDAVYGLGRIRYTQGHYPEARDLFLRALTLSPRSSKAVNNLGLCYEALGREDDAVAAYRKAIDWQQGSTHISEQPLLNLAAILITRNQADETLTLLLQAATIAPENEKVHEQLGHLYLLKDDLPKAQSELEHALRITPNSAALHFQLAQVYRKQGNLPKARAESALAAQFNGAHSSPTSN